MDDKNAELKDLDIDLEETDDVGLSLPNINPKVMSPIQKYELKKGDNLVVIDYNNEMLFDFIQRNQDTLIAFQKKLKEYEPVSEYLSCASIDILTNKIWKNLSNVEIESNLSVVHDSFQNTIRIILDKIRQMDNAIMRLRSENEEATDRLKIENNQKRNKNAFKNTSLADECQSILIDELKNDKKDIEKKYKKQTQKIKDLKDKMEQLTFDKNDLEEKYQTAVKENKKLIKEIGVFQEESSANQTENFKKLFKRIKDLHKEIEEINSDHKDKDERTMLKGLETKIDSLVDSLNEKDFQVHMKNNEMLKEIKESLSNDNHSEILEEIKKTRNDILNLKNNYVRSDSYDKALDVLRGSVEKLKEELRQKDNEILEQNDSLKCKEEELRKKYENLNQLRDADVEWLHHELDAIICQCHKSKRDHINSALYQYEAGNIHNEAVDQSSQEMEIDQVDHMAEKLQVSSCRDGSDNESREAYIAKLKELDESIKMKDKALNTIREKYTAEINKGKILEEKEQNYEENLKELNNEIKILKEVNEKQSRGITALKIQSAKFEEEITKKQRAMNNMKEKIMKFNNLENTVEEVDKLKRRIEQFIKEKESFEHLITSLREKMKERFEECEQLKKDKLRLEAEFNNMKRLNFQKKIEGLVD